MDNTDASKEHWPQVGTGLWTRWWGYLIRWLVFGVVVGLFQPVQEDPAHYWELKAIQAALGVLFGVVAAVVFTVVENKFNTPRVKWKTWGLVMLTWLVVKACFVTAIAMS